MTIDSIQKGEKEEEDCLSWLLIIPNLPFVFDDEKGEKEEEEDCLSWLLIIPNLPFVFDDDCS
jgi:hypothetical protein